MNNPVNMWDPTGHVPEWVGNDHHFETSGDASTADAYDSVGNSSSSSGWNLISQITTATEITYQYQATVTHTWVYEHTSLSEGTTITDPETGQTYYHYDGFTRTTETYSQTDYYYNNVVVTAAEIAQENEEYIRNLAGDPPMNTDPPAVSISTKQIGKEPVQLLNLKVNGSNTEGVVVNALESIGLIVNGVIDEKTLSQLENVYGQYNSPDEGKNTITLLGYNSAGGANYSNILNSLNQSYAIMTLYTNGISLSKAKINNAISYAADHGEITSVNSLNNSLNNNYDRYDTEILAWTNYWNNSLEDTEGFDKIDANYVKAIMYVESKMGYAKEAKNSNNDVMQALFPGDPSFWTQSRINSGTFYGLYHTITSKGIYKDTDGDGDKEYITNYFINTILTNGKETTASLYAPSKYLKTSVDGSEYGIPESGYGLLKTVIEEGTYNYNNVTPTMSIAFGVRWYEYRKIGYENDSIGGMVAYNGGGDPGYEDAIGEALGFMGINTKGLQ